MSRRWLAFAALGVGGLLSVSLAGLAAVGQQAEGSAGSDASSVVADGPLLRGVLDRDFTDAEVAADFGVGPEVRSLRTATSLTRLTSTPGVLATTVFDSLVHFERADGSLRRIDTSLVPGGGEGLRTAATPVRIEVADVAGADALAEVGVGGGRSVGFGLRDAAAVPASVDGSEATFADVVEGVDVELEATGGGLKERLVLASPATPRSFAFPLEVNGLDAAVDESGAVIFTEPGAGSEAVLVIPPGFMVDADGARSEGVTYSLSTGPAGGPVLDVVLDGGWLDAADRAWPVVVDPTLGVPAVTDDTYVVNGETPPVDHSGESTIQVGFDGTTASRGLVRFDFDGTDLDAVGVDVHLAELVMTAGSSASCGQPWEPSPMRLFGSPSSWDGSTAVWPGPDLTGIDPVLPDSYSFGFRGGCPTGESRAPITPLVQGWVDDPGGNHGVVLTAGDEGDADQFWEFASADASTGGPRLEVFWTVPATGWETPPETLNPAGDLGTLNPTFIARYEHPGSEAGHLSFALRLAETGQVLGFGTFSGPDGLPLPLPSGVRAAIVVTRGLPPGLDYEWRAYSYTADPDEASGVSDWTPITTPPDPGCAGDPDGGEQDDTTVTATPIPGLTTAPIEGRICNDPDVYSLTVPAGPNWWVQMAPETGVDLDFAAYDDTGDLVVRSDGVGGVDAIQLEPGSYFIEIYGYRGASGTYELEVLDAV